MKNLDKISLKPLNVNFDKLDQSLSEVAIFKEKSAKLINLMAKNGLLIKFDHNGYHNNVSQPNDYDNLSIICTKRDENNNTTGLMVSWWNKEYDYDSVSFDEETFTIPASYFNEIDNKNIVDIMKKDLKLNLEAAKLKREEIENKYREDQKIIAAERKKTSGN